MVSGPYRPERPDPPVVVKPAYNTVLQREAPIAQQERLQFEHALRKAGRGETITSANQAQGSQATRSTQAGQLEKKALSQPYTATANRTSGASPGSNALENAQPGASQYPLPGRLFANSEPGSARAAKQPGPESSTASAAHSQTLTTTEPTTGTTAASARSVLSATRPAATKTPAVPSPATLSPEMAEPADVVAGPAASTESPSGRRNKPGRAERDDSPDSAQFTVPLAGMVEPAAAATPATPVQAPPSAQGMAERFASVEAMWNHLSVMDARSGPGEWHFALQSGQSPVIGVAISHNADGGWQVAVESSPQGSAAARNCLQELREKFNASGAEVSSLQLRQGRQQ